jgi:hypothetical protein
MKRILLGALVTAACGSGSRSVLEHNRAGSGTATLMVVSDLTVSNSATSPSTRLDVDVSDGLGATVSGATVTVQNTGLGGNVALTESPTTPGHYTITKTSLPSGDFTLSVVRGTDNVQGVVVGYPNAHAINAPVVNATVPANQPLAVTWTTPMTAKSATVSTRNYTVQVPDTGTYTIPGANNPARTGQRVTVKRTNEVDIAGGLPGSIIIAEVSTTVDPFNVQ